MLTGSVVWPIGGEPTSGESVEYGIVLAMHVLVLALQGTFDLGLSALLDTLGTEHVNGLETHLFTSLTSKWV